VLLNPTQDYTRMLLASVPSMTPPPARVVPPGAAVLRASQLIKTYSQPVGLFSKRETYALKGAELALTAGQTVGVVGESGSGKSTVARCLIRLLEPSGGQIFWGEHEVATRPERELRPLRNHIQVIFQDPNRSLNPRQRIAESLMEGAMNFGASHADARSQVAKLLELVRLPQSALERYPSAFSGGQRQRLAIARALACKPRVLIADEAVSALDVSVQAQVMQLLRDVQAELGLAILFITHDLRVAAQLCDVVLVMHEGHIVEQGATAELYANPQHAYTRRLFAAAPAFVKV
jgi:peptide/nickel transport system ATP-binding protein